MTTWAAFLRGVNVGGAKITSAALRECLTDAGLKDVRTVLASGNVVFESSRARAPLKKKIEAALKASFDYEAWIVLFNAEDVRAAIDGCSLQPKSGWHTYHLLGADDTVLDDLADKAPDDEPTERGPHVLYWQVPEGQTLKTPFAKLIAGHRFKTTTTMRNARTMAKVAALL